MDIQNLFDRIEVAGDIADNVKIQFIPPESSLEPPPEPTRVMERIKAKSQRIDILRIKMRMIIKVSSIELPMSVTRQAPSVNADDLPVLAEAATELLERFAEDAENAFGELIERIGSTIAEESALFYRCMADLLPNLDPSDEDYWKFVSYTVVHTGQYRYTFVDRRIEEPVAVLQLLDDVRNHSAGTAKELKADQWIAVALERLYLIASQIYEAQESHGTDYRYRYEDAQLLGQAALRIWRFDPEYGNSRSWFPPNHSYWPFHLQGKPAVIREYPLPYGSVFNIAALPWGDHTFAVGFSDGHLFIVDSAHDTPLRQINTGLVPNLFAYTPYGLMIHGYNAFVQEGPTRQFLVLSEEGKSLENQVITERTPSQAELDEAESLSWWKRQRRLRELTTCNIVIKEGVVPSPETHPGYLTLGRLANLFLEQHPRRDPELIRFVFMRDARDSILRPAIFASSGKLKDASESSQFRLALDPARSRLIMESRELRTGYSFLVAPSVDHFAISTDGTVLALASPGHLYLYGGPVGAH
jgi:hypothetical protein